jgi:hypothetical protein
MNTSLLEFSELESPPNLYRMVARLVVFPPSRRDQRSTLARTLRLQKAWRARIRALDRAGWPATREHLGRGGMVQGRLWQMMNCPPSAIRAEPASQPCCVRAICPNCWGRWAAEQWQVVDRALFGKRVPGRARIRAPRLKGGVPRLSGKTIVVRRLSLTMPFMTAGGRYSVIDMLDRRIKDRVDPAWDPAVLTLPPRKEDLKALKAQGVEGGLEVIQISLTTAAKFPLTGDQNHGDPTGWQIAVNQVLVLPTGKVAAFMASPAANPTTIRSSLKMIESPNRKDVALAVARICRYPGYLLSGDPRITFATLKARKGRRLSTRFGTCYGSSNS